MLKVRLNHLRSDGKHKRLKIDRDSCVVGRDRECDLTIPDPRLSRRHCAIETLPLLVCVVDLKSRNGTWLNDQQLVPGEKTEIFHNDLLKIGRQTFRFSIRHVDNRRPHLREEKDVFVVEDDPSETIDSLLLSLESISRLRANASEDPKSTDRAKASEPENDATETHPDKETDGDVPENKSRDQQNSKPDVEAKSEARPEPDVPKTLRDIRKSEMSATSQDAAKTALRKIFGGR